MTGIPARPVLRGGQECLSQIIYCTFQDNDCFNRAVEVLGQQNRFEREISFLTLIHCHLSSGLPPSVGDIAD